MDALGRRRSRYVDSHGRAIEDEEALERIRSRAIPFHFATFLPALRARRDTTCASAPASARLNADEKALLQLLRSKAWPVFAGPAAGTPPVAEATRGGEMSIDVQDKLHDKLGDYVEDAHALEEGVVDNLDSMIATIDDPALKELLQRHRQVSREHVERLKRRLEQLDRGTPVRKRLEGMALALMKSVSDILRTDTPGKVGRDAYLLAHTQIAAYELLERLALSANDSETAELARINLSEDRNAADEIAKHWDDFFRLTLVAWREGAVESVSSGTPTV